MTYYNFINSGIRQSALEDEFMPPSFRKLTAGVGRLRKVNVCQIEYSGLLQSVTLIRNSQILPKPLKMVLCSSHNGIPLKFNIKNCRASNLAVRII
jgi:hypothetical protein